MPHRRQFIPDGRLNHYELTKLRQHAEKYARLQTAKIVQIIHDAKTLRSGTSSYAATMEIVRQVAKSRGFFGGLALQLEIAFTRLWRWITGKTSAYQPKAA